jgi:hypothetical protein
MQSRQQKKKKKKCDMCPAFRLTRKRHCATSCQAKYGMVFRDKGTISHDSTSSTASILLLEIISPGCKQDFLDSLFFLVEVSTIDQALETRESRHDRGPLHDRVSKSSLPICGSRHVRPPASGLHQAGPSGQFSEFPSRLSPPHLAIARKQRRRRVDHCLSQASLGSQKTTF